MQAIRRYVDSDNSCLFSSIAYLIDKSNFDENSKTYFRLRIVDYLLDNDYDSSLLCMNKEEYIQKIMKPDTWGGATELSIFSKIFKTQIASMDVQTGRVDLFGELENYDKRIYVLYNGVHYDPLVMNVDEMQSNETDICIFSPTDDNTFIDFKNFVEKINKKGDFVDLSKIENYKCNICEKEFIEEKDLMLHGQNTNHWDFIEYNESI